LTATIHIVDDDPSFRASIGRLLQACGYAVALHQSAESLLGHLPSDGGQNCILLDVRMPGLSGPELQARLNEMGLHLPIVFVTGHGDVSTAVQVIKAGAEDVLPKPVTKDQLLAPIENALRRGRVRQEEDEELADLRGRVSGLSPRERQVFERVVRGRLNKHIAHELGTTERTIKAHRHNLMEKLRVGLFVELVLVAERLGLLADSASQRDQRPREAEGSRRDLPA
jgi:FixJ family two-component response regulator